MIREDQNRGIENTSRPCNMLQSTELVAKKAMPSMLIRRFWISSRIGVDERLWGGSAKGIGLQGQHTCVSYCMEPHSLN